jgi:hypothetical protein
LSCHALAGRSPGDFAAKPSSFEQWLFARRSRQWFADVLNGNHFFDGNIIGVFQRSQLRFLQFDGHTIFNNRSR